MPPTAAKLPAVTFVIEWENAIDVADDWTDAAMAALERELRSVADRLPAKPRVMYLYDSSAVPAGTIDRVVDRVAPGLRETADLEVVPTEGLSYYKLKNFGIARSNTDLTVMVDSDAAPQPGWLAHLLQPFADPQVMVVGGFTVLGYKDLLSKTMALSWVFNLKGERAKTIKRTKIHVNNCAVRTDFFRAHPFPDLQAFKKQCVFWLQGVTAQGHKYVHTADAMVIHAPHPGVKFLAWRAWTGGMDSDFQGFHGGAKTRPARLAYALRYFARKLKRSWRNILRKGDQVDLPRWQKPFAMAISLSFYLVVLLGQLVSVATRDFDPLPKTQPLPAA
ncbi:glycosyltransferase [Sphingomonas sp.]|uniref:glycosyltransferase n=1 Tax=Sphingomonas sp. TaxID=28214 RepID=UPI00286E2DE0|nr:glycosyltransferase [Sphingomonas sp.]